MLNKYYKLFCDFFKNIGLNLDNLNDPEKYELGLQIIIDPDY